MKPVAAAAAAPSRHEAKRAVFTKLLQFIGTDAKVTLGETPNGSGLIVTEDVREGEVVLRIPKAACIGVDYQVGGLVLPQGDWPRLQAALARDDSLPWDLLLAMALLDGLGGAGTPFWQEYTETLLPAAEELCVPFCWSQERLQQLQQPAIIEGALAQQARLEDLFPGLSKPMGEDQPTWIQWAFACVRSRAFRIGAEAFAFVPFLDLANHATDPSCDYRDTPAATVPEPSGTASSGGLPDPVAEVRSAAAGVMIELVARRDLTAGQEATITYTGVQGAANRRLMAQYGFVPEGGNHADRVEFDELPEGAPMLSLARLQSGLGDAMFQEAVKRTNLTLFAALKSLPVAELGEDTGVVTEAEKQLVVSLKEQVQAHLEACLGTTMEEDEEQLAAAKAAGDARLAAAVLYRLEHKKLLRACNVLLDVYLR